MAEICSWHQVLLWESDPMTLYCIAQERLKSRRSSGLTPPRGAELEILRANGRYLRMARKPRWCSEEMCHHIAEVGNLCEFHAEERDPGSIVQEGQEWLSCSELRAAVPCSSNPINYLRTLGVLRIVKVRATKIAYHRSSVEILREWVAKRPSVERKLA